MDVPFYEDEIMPIDSSTENTMYDKSAMKLDLNNTVRCQNGFVDNSILTSPDLNLLKLASPELEKLILNSASLVTPTPQGYKNNNNQNLTVTEQQEMYARGFLEALQKLHQEQGTPGSNVPTTTYSQNPPTCTVGIASRPIVTQATQPMISTAMPMQQQMVVNSSASLNTAPSYPSINTLSTISTESLPLESVNVGVTSQIFPQFQNTGVTLSAPSNIPNGVTNYTFSNQSRLGEMKFEDSLQVVPVGTPPLPPIDLELQEAVKSERKRQRNRMAASKCRRRKLEKEAELEKKVSELKDTNSDLQNEALELRKQICQLKEQVMKHISGGCKVNFSST